MKTCFKYWPMKTIFRKLWTNKNFRMVSLQIYREKLSFATFIQIHSTEKRFPKSLDKTSILTWKLVTSYLSFAALSIKVSSVGNSSDQTLFKEEWRVTMHEFDWIFWHYCPKYTLFFLIRKPCFCQSLDFPYIFLNERNYLWQPPQPNVSIF